MRPIDADALKSVFTEKSTEAVCGAELCKAIISRICDAPTVDAKPVRHGKWIGGDLGYCTACGHEGCASDIWDGCTGMYCPNCGAKMDV